MASYITVSAFRSTSATLWA